MLLLGVADLIAALLLMRGFYNVPIPNIVIFIFAIYLFIKALIFIADIGSMMDIGAGILLVLSIAVQIPIYVLLAFAFLLGLKGVLTVFAGAKY